MTEEKHEGSNPFSHINRGIDIATRPSLTLGEVEKTGWVYDPKNITKEVKDKAAVAQELLSRNSIISKDERGAIAAEITLAKAYGDLFGLEFVVEYLRLSTSIKGKNLDSLWKTIQGSTTKISVPTTLQKAWSRVTGTEDREQSKQAVYEP